MLCVGLADGYGIPVSRLQREWTVQDIHDVVAFRRMRSRDERRAIKRNEKPPKPKQQTPDEMLRVLDGL